MPMKVYGNGKEIWWPIIPLTLWSTEISGFL